MNLCESIEVRWFLPADDARVQRLTSWFSRAPSEAPRTDRYLRVQRADLGVKERGDSGNASLVTKFRVCAFGPIHFSPTILGELERWTKLSHRSADADDGGRGWTILRKERRVRVFGLVSGRIAEATGGRLPGAGCAVELTRVEEVDSEGNAALAAWTLGLEAFGPQETLLEALYGAGRAVFAEQPDLRLKAADSKGYPAWLAERSAER
ncbi:hypothetical protein WMF04_42390 [Sorangium sp. So ce260]|uniref:hypothetical protein n=1 Tax=Sorangium sp. So ce260 TaxID=3133291 RepID=UPI003F637702